MKPIKIVVGPAVINLAAVRRVQMDGERTPTSYNPRLYGAAAEAAQQDPNKPEGACCNAMERDFAGGCVNCGDLCL